MKKRIWSLLLCAALLLTLAAVLPGKAQAATPTKDSDGYYLIGNEDDLFAFATLVNGGEYGANGKLTADITMTGETKPWTPIGNTRLDAQAYSGTFDGQGYTISKLYCADRAAQRVGLFGYVNGGTIRNVTVADGTFAGSRCGAIVGYMKGNGTIEGCANRNCAVTGTYAGGIVGNAYQTNIRACWNTGNVTSDSSTAGGICGWSDGAVTIKGCWNTGKITGERCGGIMGCVSGNTESVTYCYNDGVVVAGDSDYEGAIIGFTNSTDDPKMSYCYYTWPSGGARMAYGEKSDGYFTNVDEVSSSMLPTGGCAWLLNQGLTGTGYKFYQNLDNDKTVDAYPVLDSSHGTVYRGYKACSDTYSYSNSTLPQSFYHEGIRYEVKDRTIKEVCTNESCEKGTDLLGSITMGLNTENYYTGNPVSASVMGSFKNGATYKLTYDGSEEAPSEVGNYTAKLTVYEDSDEKACVEVAYTIRYLSAPALSEFTVEGHSYEAGGVYWFKDASAVVTPPEGFTIAKTLGEYYETETAILADGGKTVYLRRVEDGALTDAIDLRDILKFDSTAPEDRVNLSTGNFWTELEKKAPFGMFLNEAMAVEIEASDNQSGIKSMQYYVADHDLIGDMALDSADAIEKLEAAVGVGWSDYTGAIPLALNGKYVVYAKVTDNVGNVSYASTTGIVIYTDAAVSQDDFTATYGEAGDVKVPVTFNGNTVKEIRENALGVLVPEEDYTVEEDGITLKADLLNELQAGTRTFTVTCNPMGEEYVDTADNQKPAELTITITVHKKAVPVPEADTTSFVYSGTELVYGIDETAFYTVTGNKKTNAGDYTVTVSLKDAGNTHWADRTIEDKTYPFSIAKATFDMSNAKWNYTEPFHYDGKVHTVELTGLPAGVTASYSGNTAKDVRDYTASVTFSYDSANYNEPVMAALNWQIVNDWEPAEYTATARNDGGWANQVFVITPEAGYQVSLTNTAEGEWKDQLTYAAETDNGSVTFYLKNEQGHISLEKTENYKVDMTNPYGGITVEERSWEGFFGAIFDFFSNKDMAVTITAQDDLSGVAVVEYYESAEALDLEGVMAVTEWENGAALNVTKEDAKRFIYYARITDMAGNVAYLASNGTEFDTVMPEVTCPESEVYYVSTQVTVTDKNLATVDVGEGPVDVTGDTFTWVLPGNRDAEYTVTATDKAGNVTIRFLKTATIASIGQPVADMTEENVKMADENTLDRVQEAMDAIDKSAATEEEKAALQALEDKVKALEERLEDLEQTVDSDIINENLQVDKETVTLEDKEDLQQVIEDLEKVLEDYAGNLDQEEKDIIQAQIRQWQDAMTAIENAEDVQKTIDDLPETAEPDDEDAMAAAKDAMEAYEELTDTEKEMVDTGALDRLMDALAQYRIVKGDKGVWKGEGTLQFTANGAFSKFEGIAVDGEEVAAKGYTAKAGSTVITLTERFLKTLEEGEHEITVRYTDGEAEGTFTVTLPEDEKEEPTEPEDEEDTKPSEDKDEETKPSKPTEGKDETGETEPVAKPDKKPESSTPGTGDKMLMVSGAVAVLALIALVVLLVIKRKQNKQ